MYFKTHHVVSSNIELLGIYLNISHNCEGKWTRRPSDSDWLYFIITIGGFYTITAGGFFPAFGAALRPPHGPPPKLRLRWGWRPREMPRGAASARRIRRHHLGRAQMRLQPVHTDRLVTASDLQDEELRARTNHLVRTRISRSRGWNTSTLPHVHPACQL